MDDKELKRLYKIYGEKFIQLLAVEIKRSNKIASGALLNSIAFELKDIAKGVEIIVGGEKYLGYVDEGRKPGKYAPIKEIEKWCSIKGIPKSAAWAINKKIFKFGIKPTNIIDKAIKSFSGYATKRLEEDLAKEIEEQLIKGIKK